MTMDMCCVPSGEQPVSSQPETPLLLSRCVSSLTDKSPQTPGLDRWGEVTDMGRECGRWVVSSELAPAHDESEYEIGRYRETEYRMNSYTIGTHTVRLHQEHRLFFIDTDVIRATPTEYRLMVCLLTERVASDVTLAAQGFGHRGALDKSARENLEKHLYNLRVKIRPYGLTMHRVHNLGYILTEVQAPS